MGTNSKKRRRQMAGGSGQAAIVFDPEARKEYLQGFSKRKEERRAYGLAMQKVKDRKHRLEQRAELKRAEKEQVEQAEKQKESQIEEYMLDRSVLNGMGFAAALTDGDDKEIGDGGPKKSNKKKGHESDTVDKVEMYQDELTRAQWGGEVIVTTSSRIPGFSDDEDDDDPKAVKQRANKKRKTVDEEQEYAGNVEKYLNEIKSKLPSMKKRKKDANKKHKGVHGASNMKGVSGPADMMIAKRALDRFQKKGGGGKKGAPQSSASNNRRKKR